MSWSIIFIFLFSLGLNLLPCNANSRICFTEIGVENYTVSSHICCNGVITQRVRHQECCDNKFTYFTNSQLCCGGQVVERFVLPNGIAENRYCSDSDKDCREQICCGDKIVNKDETLCCQNKPIDLDHSQLKEKDFLKCCGQTLLNQKTHFCCNDTRYIKSTKIDCCGVTIFDKNVERCLENFKPPKRVGLYKDICGGIEFDVRENSCCSGVINDMPLKDITNDMKLNRNLYCCDSIAYDSTKNKCCRENHTGFKTHIITIEPNIFCCGDGFYNATHQDCYEGRVLEKVPGKQLCGDVYVDGVIEQCCENKVTFNATSHDCCTGDKFNVIPKNQICCNGEGINDNKLCCEDIIPCNKKGANDDSCCYNYMTGKGETYSSMLNQFCFDGRVMTIPAEAKPCSSSNYYYPDKEICCGGRAVNISSGYDKCCDDKPYSSTLQQCCNLEISNIPETEGSCCQVDLKVYRYDDGENPCRQPCGYKTYDYTREICCEGKVHVRGDSTVCCGSSVINSYSEKCCGGVFPVTGNTRKCCGDRELFDNRYFKCRHGKIVPQDLFLRKQPGVARLCNHRAVKHFDGGIKYACESLYVVKARVSRVQISRKHNPKIIYIKMLLSEVRSLNRGENFTEFSGPNSLNFTIEVPNADGLKCQKRYLDRYCEVIVFFNARVLKNGLVKISGHSKFFMTGYTRQRERTITNQLSYRFCQDKFSIHNKS